MEKLGGNCSHSSATQEILNISSFHPSILGSFHPSLSFICRCVAKIDSNTLAN